MSSVPAAGVDCGADWAANVASVDVKKTPMNRMAAARVMHGPERYNVNFNSYYAFRPASGHTIIMVRCTNFRPFFAHYSWQVPD